jgi:uncharacterized phage protein gp47/JayE
VLGAGANGTELPMGTQLRRSDGALFVTTSDATVADLAVTAPVAASVAGRAGDTDAGATLTLVSPITGIGSTFTVVGAGDGSGLSGGTDLETDDELRARIIERRRKPPQGAATPDYEERAATVPGVDIGNIWVYKRWMGAGTVGLTFVMSDRSIPTDDEVAAVQTALDDPDWAYVIGTAIAFKPSVDACNVTLHLVPDTADLRTAVEAALATLFATQGAPGGAPLDGGTTGGTIQIGHIWDAVNEAVGTGEAEVTAPVADFTAARGHLPVLGTVTFV